MKLNLYIMSSDSNGFMADVNYLIIIINIATTVSKEEILFGSEFTINFSSVLQTSQVVCYAR